jgi:hypothetical protein
MAQHEDGSGEFTSVVLKPRVTITDRSRAEEAQALHHKAHELCFIARSVNFPVEHRAVVEVRRKESGVRSQESVGRSRAGLKPRAG